MNKTLTLSVAMMATLGFTVNAKRTNDPFHNKEGKLSARQVHTIQTAGKTNTTIASRLLSTGTSMFDGGSFNLNDSIDYKYATSDLRGFYNDLWEDWDYDTANRYSFPVSSPILDRRMYNQYNTSNKPTLMVGESFNGTTWDIEERSTITYDASGNVSTFESESNNGSGLEKEYKVSAIYDVTNKLVSTTEQDWDGATYVDAYRTTYTYNSNGDILEEHYEVYNGTSWDVSSRTSYTYDASFNATEIFGEDYDGGWSPAYKTYQFFNSNNEMYENHFDVYTGGTWITFSISKFTYDANHNTITSEHENFDGTTIVPVNMSDMTYNSYNQMLTQNSKTWNAGNNQYELQMGDGEQRMHYEEFAVSVKDVAKQQTGSMNVFPVPAADFVNIKLSLNKPQGIFIILQDATGKVVKTCNEAAGKQYLKKLSTDNMAPGNYVIKVIAGGEQYTQKITIAK